MKMVLIVGGAGYIGSHTAKHLRERGFQCVIVDNLSLGHEEAACSCPFEQADILDGTALDRIFVRYRPDAVMHFAALSLVGESMRNPREYYRNNCSGTLSLVDAMVRHNVKNIVFSSSCAVYGNPDYTPLDESHPTNPISPYGQTKLMIERMLHDYQYAYGLNHISLRYFNAAGASADGKLGESHTPETHLIPLVLRAIAGKIPRLSLFGTDYETNDGTCERDFIHVEDLARAHALALQKLGTVQGGMNLGTGKTTSVRQVIQAAERITGQTCPVDYCPRRPGDPAVLFASCDKARQCLGWKPEHLSIDSMISSAWEWECHRRY